MGARSKSRVSGSFPALLLDCKFHPEVGGFPSPHFLRGKGVGVVVELIHPCLDATEPVRCGGGQL